MLALFHNHTKQVCNVLQLIRMAIRCLSHGSAQMVTYRATEIRISMHRSSQEPLDNFGLPLGFLMAKASTSIPFELLCSDHLEWTEWTKSL